MSHTNPRIVDYVLEKCVLRQQGMDYSNERIALELNTLFDTAHTKESVRHIWRRHRDSLEQHLEQSKKYVKRPAHRTFVPLEANSVLFIPDLHIPFVAPGFIEFLVRVKNKFQPDIVVSVGDIVDQCALSFFAKDPDGDSAGSELEKTRLFLQELVEEFPSLYITIGNHDNRHLRQAMKAGIPKEYIKDFLEIFNLPETWVWHNSFILNGDTLIEHGTASGLLATYNRAWGTSKNVVQGHTHSYAGILYMNDGLNQRWALNVGCGIDSERYAFNYAIDKERQPTLGCAIVSNGVPAFIPFNE